MKRIFASFIIKNYRDYLKFEGFILYIIFTWETPQVRLSLVCVYSVSEKTERFE